MYNTYDVGDLIRLEADITISGSYVDPTYLALTVKKPDETEVQFVYSVEPTFIKDTVGRYHYNYYIADYGQHVYKFQASGTAWGVEDKIFVARIPKA